MRAINKWSRIFLLREGPGFFYSRNRGYESVRSTVYATFVILTGPVHATARFHSFSPRSVDGSRQDDKSSVHRVCETTKQRDRITFKQDWLALEQVRIAFKEDWIAFEQVQIAIEQDWIAID